MVATNPCYSRWDVGTAVVANPARDGPEQDFSAEQNKILEAFGFKDDGFC
jgi:hypothetical protein